MRRNVCMPWALIGDFNDILTPSEQTGGNFPVANATSFVRGIADYDLIDMISLAANLLGRVVVEVGYECHDSLTEAFVVNLGVCCSSPKQQ